MQYLYDETGRRYLDLFAGIVTVSVGHCHPKVVQRVTSRSATLQHATTIYLHPNFPLLAKKLASKMPKGLDVTYFMNSGQRGERSRDHDGAAVHRQPRRHRAAQRLSRRQPERDGPDVAQHVEVSGRRRRARAPRDQSRSVPQPVRRHAGGDRHASRAATSASSSATRRRARSPRSSPSRSRASAARRTGAPNYLKEAYAIIREHGGLCIADEVQTGFGRTGEHYWGFQNFGVVPDFVTMAKGIGNGAPLAAVTTRMEIAQDAHAAHPLQHVRRQSRVDGRRARGARRHRRGRAPGELRACSARGSRRGCERLQRVARARSATCAAWG